VTRAALHPFNKRQQLRLTRALGVYLLILYALYLAIIINDSAMRPARPPA
jgi:Ca2+/Na+ antiporter